MNKEAMARTGQQSTLLAWSCDMNGFFGLPA